MKVASTAEALATPVGAWLSRRSHRIASTAVGDTGVDIDEIVQWYMAGRFDPDDPGWHGIPGNPESGSRPPDYKTSTVLRVGAQTLTDFAKERGGVPGAAYEIGGERVIAAEIPEIDLIQAGLGDIEVALREGRRDTHFALGALTKYFGLVHRFEAIGDVEVMSRLSNTGFGSLAQEHPDALRI